MQLKDRVCIVTGAASGIGRQAALTFAREGARVAFLDVQKEKLEDAVNEAKEYSEVKAYVCDLRDMENIETIVQKIHNDFGRIDVLANIAGVAIRLPIEEISISDWDFVNDINLKAPFFMAKEVYKIMLKQKSGKIINLASHRAEVTDGRHVVYDATKAGLKALTRSFAICGGPEGIVANSVTPAYVITPMTEHNLENENFKAHIKDRIPIGRCLEMQEVANLILYLASDNSTGINGQNFIIDGGWTIHE